MCQWLNAWSTQPVNPCCPLSCLLPVWPSQLSTWAWAMSSSGSTFLSTTIKPAWLPPSVHCNCIAGRCTTCIAWRCMHPTFALGISRSAVETCKAVDFEEKIKRELHKIFARCYSWLKRGTSIAHRLLSFSGFLLHRCSFHDPVAPDYYRNEHLIIKVK